MPLSSLTPTQLSAGQIALAALLAVAGFALLLPRPKGRAVKEGVAALVAALAVFGIWLYGTFGDPMPDAIGAVLFGLFSLGALGFGAALVLQRNPARGAIAFAFVILSTCGLFLLLAAPFLMAATIIIYAGAIIVTFLFVLMLSHAAGPSDENDRSREPLFGAFAGFAFTGLVLFTLYLTQLGTTPAKDGLTQAEQRLPATVLTPEERKTLTDAVAKFDATDEQLKGDTTPPAERSAVTAYFEAVKNDIAAVVGSLEMSRAGSLRTRLEKIGTRPGEKNTVPLRTDEQASAVLRRAAVVRELNEKTYNAVYDNVFEGKPVRAAVKADLRKLRDEVLLLSGSAELPARNAGNLGYLLYTNHLLAVELAGTLLLVATIGAVAIAQRKGAVQ